MDPTSLGCQDLTLHLPHLSSMERILFIVRSEFTPFILLDQEDKGKVVQTQPIPQIKKHSGFYGEIVLTLPVQGVYQNVPIVQLPIDLDNTNFVLSATGNVEISFRC
jgi:hypothetical protein